MIRFALAASVALFSGMAAPAQAASSLRLNYIGQQIITPGAQAFGTTIGGLSGLDYDSVSKTYLAISDDRSQIGPARFYNLSLNLTSTAFNGVNFTAVQTFKRPDGTLYPALGLDPESIRFSRSGGIIYTSEGDANALQAPFVREANLNGSFIRDFNLPAYYLPSVGQTGIRNNLSFENLTITPNGSIFAANENALKQDGSAATLTSTSPTRFIAFDPVTGNPTAEYVYNADAIAQPPVPTTNFAVSGLTDLLAVSDTRFIGIERSFSVGAPGTGYAIKLYEINLAGATNVLGLSSLANAAYTPVSKTLLLDLGTLGIPLDNIEGITFGQTLENGHRSLILVSDDNFNANQFTQFLAFDVAGIPEPASWAMMIIGFGCAGGAMRRRKQTPQTA